MCDNEILMTVFVVINANDWNKIINAKLSFLRWFGLINDAYTVVMLIDEIVDYIYNQECLPVL